MESMPDERTQILRAFTWRKKENCRKDWRKIYARRKNTKFR